MTHDSPTLRVSGLASRLAVLVGLMSAVATASGATGGQIVSQEVV